MTVPEVVDPWDVGRQVRRDFGTGWRGVYEYGPFSDLMGRRREGLPRIKAGNLTAELPDHGAILEATAASDPVPAALLGRVTPGAQIPDPVFVAVLFDDEIVAVGRTYEHRGTGARLTALVPPGAFRGGVEDVDLLRVDRDSSGLTLSEITLAPPESS